MNKFEFEAKAFAAAETIVDARNIEFYAGTMFVKCVSVSAAQIETALIEALKCGVIVSKVGPEYCFDFVK